MAVDPSEAGPYSIGPDNQLKAGDSRALILAEQEIGGKKGYLTKLYGRKGGMDYAYITNSSGFMVHAEVSGGDGPVPVPSATSLNLDGPVSIVRVSNPNGGTDDIAATDLDVSVGNNVRKSQGGFSGNQFLSDVVPGYGNG